MLEKLKVKMKTDPEKVKKVGTIAGAVIGVAAVGIVLYLKRDQISLPSFHQES